MLDKTGPHQIDHPPRDEDEPGCLGMHHEIATSMLLGKSGPKALEPHHSNQAASKHEGPS